MATSSPFTDLAIIPQPQKARKIGGIWELPETLKIYTDSDLRAAKEILEKPLKNQNRSIIFEKSIKPKDEQVTFLVNPKIASGYTLLISALGIKAEASSVEGLFQAAISMAQLLHIHSGSLPCLEISDEPRFSWRGFMLDCCRFFQPVDSILNLIDVLAMYKFNILHLHLTEDQGWRLEIPGYPELSKVGSTRIDSMDGSTKKSIGEPHSGFYNAEDIKTIVDYAADRFIQIVPEIDIPGHTMAALASYPELGCTGGPYEVPFKAGIYKDILCAGKEETYKLLEAVIKTTSELFPAPYIHLGGDEAPKSQWKKCPHCAEYRTEHGIKSVKSQQTFFTNQVIEIVKKYGKQPLGWSEVCTDELDPSMVGQFWLWHKKEAYRQAANGRKMIFSNHGSTYIDQSHAFLPLNKAYDFNPVPADLSRETTANILGIECPLWTEWVPTKERRDFQSFPRAMAIAEAAWTKTKGKDFNHFLTRLKMHTPIHEALEITLAPEEKWLYPRKAKWKAVIDMILEKGIKE